MDNWEIYGETLARLQAQARPHPRSAPQAGAGPEVPFGAFRPHSLNWDGRPTLLLGLGDSITFGTGGTLGGYFDLLQRNHSTISEMRNRSLFLAYPILSSLNLSENFSTSREHVEQVRHLPTQKRRGIVCLTTGGNDLIHPYGEGEPCEGACYGCTAKEAKQYAQVFADRLVVMLMLLDNRFPKGFDLFVANIYDPTDGFGDLQNAPLPLPPWPDAMDALTYYNEEIARICKEVSCAHLVDIHSLFMGHGIHTEELGVNDYWYWGNLEDPNAHGHDAIRRAFLLKMIKVLGR